MDMEVPRVPALVNVQPAKASILSAKTLAESPNLTSVIPAAYHFTVQDSSYDYELADPNDPEFQIPTIDFSLLTASASPGQRSKVIHQLGKACQDWGCFTVTNHGMAESQKQSMIDAADRFFNLTEEEKQSIAKKYESDPTQLGYGTSFDSAPEEVRLWREFVKLRVHPRSHSGIDLHDQHDGYSEVAAHHCQKTRQIATELLNAISESLGLEADYIYKALDLENGVHFLLSNYYPPCPQPHLAMGLARHTDQGLITLLADNDVCGLQVLHNHKWVSVTSMSKPFLVILADQMQIVTNGKYKSALHRGRVNKESKRLSVASLLAPPFDTVVTPSPELVEREGQPRALYRSIKYRDYAELVHRCRLDFKFALDEIRI